MTIFELVEQLRSRLDDYGGGDRVDQEWLYNDEEADWSNAELVGFLAEAEDEFCRRVPITDATTTACSRITLVDGTIDYALHDSVLYVENVELIGGPSGTGNDSVLEHTTHIKREADGAYYGGGYVYSSFVNGTPARYYSLDLDERRISIWPKPNTDYDARVLKLTVGRLPITRMAWNTATARTTSPSIHYLNHPALVHWAEHRALLNSDSEVNDLQKSSDARNLFDAEVGERESARIERFNQRTRNRRTRARAQFV